MTLGAEPLSPAARRVYVSAGARTIAIDRARDEPSGSHGKASEVSRIDDGAGHSVQGRRDRRAGLSRADRLADHLRLARAGAGRNDRREPDALAQRTLPRRRHLHRRSARPGSGDRRRGLQQHASRRSSLPATPSEAARTPFWSSRPITTSRRRKASTSTSRPSTTQSEFRSSSTTFPREASSTCRSTR